MNGNPGNLAGRSGGAQEVRRNREDGMPKRDTHARIYQGELDPAEYCELKRLSGTNKTPIRRTLIDSIRAYLGNWDKGEDLDIEQLPLDDGKVRFYLWVPYELCDELDRAVAKKGTYIQKLLKSSLKCWKSRGFK